MIKVLKRLFQVKLKYFGLLNSKGFSLIEVTVTMGIMSIVAVTGTYMLIQSSRQSKNLEVKLNAFQFHSILHQVMLNSAAWTNTVEDTANAKLNNCLRLVDKDFTACTDTLKDDPAANLDDPERGYHLVLRGSNNTVFLDSTDNNLGMTAQGTVCNNFSNTNEDCPFKPEVFWRFECIQKDLNVNASCADPMVVLTARIRNESKKYRGLNFSAYNVAVVKDYSKPNDPSVVVCDSVNGKFDSVLGQCVQNLNATCPSGYFVHGVKSDGTLDCVAAGQPKCSFSLSTSSLNEPAADEDFLLQVDLSNASTKTVSVNYSVNTENTTATSGGETPDFVLASGTLTFDPGDVQKSITISVLEDTTSEEDETIDVILDSPVNCDTIAPDSHTVTIVDDDNNEKPTVFFSTLRNINVSDVVDSTVQMSIMLSKPLSVSSSITYSKTSGSAGEGTDFTLSGGGSVTFSPGETVKTIDFNVQKDTLLEGIEEATITLSDPVEADLGSSEQINFTVTISETPTISFVNATKSVSEADGAITETVHLSNSSTSVISVSYELDNMSSSAAEGNDFDFINGTLNFPAGATSQSITYTVKKDSIAEGAETIKIDLINIVGAQLGYPGSHVATLSDSSTSPLDGVTGGCYVNSPTPDSTTPSSCISEVCSESKFTQFTMFSVGSLLGSGGYEFTNIDEWTIVWAGDGACDKSVKDPMYCKVKNMGDYAMSATVTHKLSGESKAFSITSQDKTVIMNGNNKCP